MIVLQGSMPDICKKCKKTGGLEDGLYLIHTEENFVNFYCDGQSLKICPIKGEIPDEHGRIIDSSKAEEFCDDWVHGKFDYDPLPDEILSILRFSTPTILEASK